MKRKKEKKRHTAWAYTRVTKRRLVSLKKKGVAKFYLTKKRLADLKDIAKAAWHFRRQAATKPKLKPSFNLQELRELLTLPGMIGSPIIQS